MTPILAIDPGERRIGIATSDEAGHTTARDVWTLNRAFWPRLKQLTVDGGYELILVGRPRSIGGELRAQARRSGEFAGRVRRETGLEVRLVDETATTEEARKRLEGQGPEMLDAVAAQIILEDYLSEHSD